MYDDLKEWHQYKDSVKWRLTAKGVEIEGDGIPRSRGAPATAKKIWNTFRNHIEDAATKYGVPIELIIATIATESGGNPKALRKEPGYKSDTSTPHRISPGLMQTLISTAEGVLKRDLTREELLNPRVSIIAGTAYIAQQAKYTNLDPVKVSCAYNAGNLYHQKGAKNRWKLRQYPIGSSAHADRFVEWFNDTIAMLAAEGYKGAAPSFYASFAGGGAPIDRKVVEKKLEKKEVVVVKNAKKSSLWGWIQAIFAALFGAPAATSTLLDTAQDTTGKTKDFFEKVIGVSNGTVLSVTLLIVGGIAVYIVLKQKGIIAERVEDEVVGRTDSNDYVGNGTGESVST